MKKKNEGDFGNFYEILEGQDKVMLLAYLHLAARKSELWYDLLDCMP
jgi:hypothetical protein